MAKRLFTTEAISFTATAAGSAATSGQYMAIQGGSATQIIDILEILISGMASSSTVVNPNLTRVSTLQTGTVTGLAAPNSDGPMNANTAALAAPPVTFIASGTAQSVPSAATTDARINLAVNAFGGIIRWNAAPTQQWTQIGSAVTVGESILWNNSSGNGVTGPFNVHLMYEPY